MTKKTHISSLIGIAVCTLQQADGSIQLFPAGQFDAPRGAMAGSGPWLLDETAATALINRVQQRDNDIVIDYEHQTLSSVNNGKPAPAAGWLKPANLHWAAGKGLIASNPDWTDKAKSHIDADEYRYLSPVFSYDKKTGRVLDLLHVALTNNPAIDGMEDVVLAAAKFLPNQQEDTSMNDEERKALAKQLGLSADATVEKVMAACSALTTANTELTQQLADKDEAIAAASAATPETAMTAITGLQAEIAALTSQVNDGQVDELIAAAKSQGKIMPALEPWLREMAKNQGVAALNAYIDITPAVAALTGTQTGGKQAFDEDGKAVLSDEQIAVCSQLGLDQDEFKKTLAEESA